MKEHEIKEQNHHLIWKSKSSLPKRVGSLIFFILSLNLEVKLKDTTRIFNPSL
jgi:hypothetical protein